MNSENNAPQSLKDFVLQSVREHWDAKGQPLLLSRLGQAAVSKGINLRDALGGRKLGDFIGEELRDELEVEPLPDSPSLLQAKPRGEKSPPAEAPVPEHPGLRLHKALWLAFSRAIPHGYERRIQLEPVVRFWDALPPLDEVAGRLPIGPGYVAPMGDGRPQERNDAILENIRRWMRDHALDISNYESGKSVKALPSGHGAASNLLMQLIAALDESELKRVSLPLDVVAKLLKK